MKPISKYILEMALGVLMIGLGLSLALRHVPPNSLYGFRVAATLSNPSIWYQVNSWMGVGMVVTGVLTLIVATIAKDRSPRSWVPFIVLYGGLSLCLIPSYILANSSMGKEPHLHTSTQIGGINAISPLYIELFFIWLSVLFIVIGLPLAMNRIKPNGTYGFRVSKTLSDERIWYLVNSYYGKGNVLSGIITTILAVVLRLIATSPATYGLIWLIALFGGLVSTIIASFTYMKRIS